MIGTLLFETGKRLVYLGTALEEMRTENLLGQLPFRHRLRFVWLIVQGSVRLADKYRPKGFQLSEQEISTLGERLERLMPDWRHSAPQYVALYVATEAAGIINSRRG
jgi:hypothetical protein